MTKRQRRDVPAVIWETQRIPAAAVRWRWNATDLGSPVRCHMAARDLRRHCRLIGPVEALLCDAVNRLGLSARAYHQVLKIARTIADLEDSPDLTTAHVGEAIQYRSLDRRPATV
jgi:magnesium chelatase family protein